MSNTLSPELQKQIEQDAEHYANVQVGEKAKFIGHHLSHRWDDAKGDYETGAFSIAEKWQESEQRAERYEKALKAIRDWQLPPTGQFWDDDKTKPMSYAACYGSNGERDFMRNIANEALTPKTSNDERRL
jgi:hypothetical protein